jgi:hypothetical protein
MMMSMLRVIMIGKEEVAACLDLMGAFDLIAQTDEVTLKAQLSRISKMIYRLYQPSAS